MHKRELLITGWQAALASRCQCLAPQASQGGAWLQEVVSLLLEWHVAWLCDDAASSELPDASVRWLYALAALVERPLPAAAAAALRALLRRCAALAARGFGPSPGAAPWGSAEGPGNVGGGSTAPRERSCAEPGSAPGGAPAEPSPGQAGVVVAVQEGYRDRGGEREAERARMHILVAIAGAYFRQDEALAWLSREEYV